MGGKDPTAPSSGWRWVRLSKEMTCSKCGNPMTIGQNIIAKMLRLPDAAEPVEVPLHPLCAAAVSARRVLLPDKPGHGK